MSLPERTTVLIVGAGPSGLTAALSLYKQGIHDIVIIDAVAQGNNASRALAIHAATLEALDTIGCADTLVQAGTPSGSFNLALDSGPLFSADFSSLAHKTKFPFMLLVPQNITERILVTEVERVGMKVFRPYKVVGMTKKEGTSGITNVLFESGEVVQANYVIGADGARSAVRQLAGIGFSDPEGNRRQDASQVVLADVALSDAPDISPDLFRLYVLHGGVFLLAPLPASWRPSKNVYRIVCSIPANYGSVPQDIDTEWLQKLVDDLGPSQLSSNSANPHSIRITQTLWSSRFRTHSAIADRVFTRFEGDKSVNERKETAKEGGVIFLVGDAAHVHSPAGGQGMNLGICDAIKLGPQLASHIQFAASGGTSQSSYLENDKILSDFAAVRHARALAIITHTNSLSLFLSVSGKQGIVWWIYIVRQMLLKMLLRVVGRFAFFRNKAAFALSGLGSL